MSTETALKLLMQFRAILQREGLQVICNESII